MREIDKRIIELYKAGNTQREVAAALDVSRDVVRYSLKKYGIKTDALAKVIVCKECGENYQTTRATTKFCSDYCRLKNNKKTTLQKQRECERCGKSFKTYKSKFCSEECRRQPVSRSFNQLKVLQNAKSLYLYSCSMCDTQMMQRRRGIKYCTECKKVQTARSRKAFEERQRVFHDVKCRECGGWFRTTRGRDVYCSMRCADKYHDRMKTTKRRERIMLNGEVHWNISIERLIKRDKSTCYLCGEKVDKNDFTINDGGHHISGDYYPSIEHVIPISKGGTHTWDNVKLAHRICNIIKSDKEINGTKYKQKLNPI